MTNKNSNMSNILSSIPFFLILCFVFLSIPQAVMAKKGVDDIRGRWDISIEGFEENLQNFTMFIGNLIYTEETGDFFANGCMESPSQELSPLAFRAKLIEEGTYDVIIISTVIPEENGYPFVIQFFGKIHTFRKGIADDIGGGDDSKIKTEFFEGGNWAAKHIDRSNEECPPVEIPPLSFHVDLRAHHTLYENNLIHRFIGFDCGTNIVSSGILVEVPNNASVLIEPYTDIFSPDVEFISNFRFTGGISESDPVVGVPYIFKLLDSVGNEILGTTQEDIWYGCNVGATKNLQAEITIENNILISWDAVPTVSGFDPPNDIGFYQIEIFAWPEGGETLYGANWVGETSHLIPWNEFVPSAAGSPDGNDLGVSLSNLENGEYMIRIVNHGFPNPESSGVGFECIITDMAEIVLFEKTDSELKIVPLPE